MTEPTTVLTDYLLGAVLLILAWRALRQDRHDPRTARRLWAWGFVTLGLSALAGGTWHGFSGRLGAGSAAALWKGTVYLVGVTDLLMLWGSAAAALSRRVRPYVVAAVVAKFLVYAVFMIGHDEFRYVVYDYVPSMVAILLIHAVPGSLRNDPGARFILAGIVLSFVAALVQLVRLAPHPHFNHNDLYHVIQIAACCVLYRGVIRLRDRGALVRATLPPFGGPR
jgi:hypothetical protein